MSNHSFIYLKNQSWSQITREERFFCSHLYHSILNREKDFVKWLNENLNYNKADNKIELNPNKDWEIGYEVCFYRDFLKLKGKYIKTYLGKNGKPFPQKRTFDLCLFSEDQIIIIEAKVQQGFSTKQVGDIKEDSKLIKKLLGEFNYSNVKSDTIFLYSSRYNPKDERIRQFSYFYWKQLIDSNFNTGNYFADADKIFRK